MGPVKVVIHYANGKLLKGFTNDFFPNKSSIHVYPVDTGRDVKGTAVVVNQLKALFFVKDFAGNPSYHDRKHFTEGRQGAGRKAEVTFADGEVLVGSTLGYDPNRPGFFITPADMQSNNLRVFVVLSSVKKFRFL